MPASQIMKKFEAGTLHSGKGGSIVTNPKQAIAIKLSYLRKEGEIPNPKQKLGIDGKYTPEKGMKGHLNLMKSKGVLKTKKVKSY